MVPTVVKKNSSFVFSQFGLNLNINKNELMPETELKWDSMVALLVEKNIKSLDEKIVKLVFG